MKVLITGAAGFIGSTIIDRLKERGDSWTGIDNLQTGRAQNCLGFSNRSIIEPGVFQEFGKHDLIIHCAASYDDRNKWHRDTDTNVSGAINVAIAAREWECPVIYFQTALCYGNNPYKKPIKMLEAGNVIRDTGEWMDGESHPVTLDHPLNPESSYAISKVAAEQYLRLAEVPLTVFRLANIYGPRNLSGPIPAFWKRLTTDEPVTVVDSRRDFVYIDDLVNLVVQAIDRYGTDRQPTGVFHVSTGSDYAISQLYEAVCGAMDRYDAFPAPIMPRGDDDAPTILLDPSATKAQFGWEATTDLDEGVEQAVNWYEANGVTEIYTHLKVQG